MSNMRVRTELSEKLSRIIKTETNPKSSDLLKAYATFAAMGELSSERLIEGYVDLLKARKYPSNDYLRISRFATLEHIQDAYLAFRQFTDEEFLRFIVSDLVVNTAEMMQLYKSVLSSDVLRLTHVILQLRLLMYRTDRAALDSDDSDVGREGRVLPGKSALQRIYRRYCDQEKEGIPRLSIEEFRSFYRCINLFPINGDALSIKAIGYKKERLDQLIDILNNQLELSREQQIELCYRFHVEGKQSKFFVNSERLYRFFKIKQTTERKKLFQQALILLAEIPPADALAAISVRRRASRRRSNSLSDQIYSPNDVPLETSLIYSLFTSTVGPVRDETKGVTVLFPSVFFVRKWLSDEMLAGQKVCFVFEDSFLCGTLSYHYHAAAYGRTVGKQVSFLSLTDWMEHAKSQRQMLHEDKLLAFFCGKPLSIQETIYKLIYQQGLARELLLVLGCHEFEGSRSPFSPALDDPRFRFRSIELLPQGINNSAFPRRKMFVQAEILDDPAVSKEKVFLSADVLNLDLKTQAIARGLVPPIAVDPTELKSLYSSIRSLYEKELLTREASGKTKAPAFSYPFTPDLTIWCSKTYPEGNHGRPRLEAYFCQITPAGKAERGFADRGLALLQTKKHIVKLCDSEIISWLETKYPFESVRLRTSDKKKELDQVQVSIQEIAIDYYTKALAGENLALKTFWYLYPNLKDLFSGQAYQQLCTMIVYTEIGALRLEDVSPNDVEEILTNSFQNDSENLLYQKFLIISKMVDKAVELGYCQTNPLAQTIQDVKTRDKLFSQVRRALTKKHFTHNEFRVIYELAVRNLEQGNTEYLGVLLRLLTGLSGNVICALKWKDLHSVEDYGMSKIIIERQVVNDGSSVKGFESLEDYLCFPCSDLLVRHLETAYQITKTKYPTFTDFSEWPIIRSSAGTNKRGGAKTYYPPRELESLCKQLVETLNLPDRIVSIPSAEDGTKETNLNDYGGDFFRENFRFWTMSYAGLTNDETAYLIGNTPETTFGRYYCDYLNDASQYLLYVKLRRLDALLSDKGTPAVIIERSFTGDFCESLSTGSQQTGLQLRVTLPQDATRFELELNSKYAFSTSIVPINSKEGSL